ncbi:MAG TPA: ABC transporter permease [Streptosporangiaceae bacterium]|jgi:ABC-2 type transport system permease protein
MRPASEVAGRSATQAPRQGAGEQGDEGSRRHLAPRRRAGNSLLLAPHAEWTKLRTVPGTGWLLAGIVAATVAVSVLALAATRCPAGVACPADTARLSLTGVQAGQAVVAVLAVLAVSSEYSTGMIRVTLAAMPRRAELLAAKAAVVTGLVLAAGTAAVAGCLLAGRLLLPGHGFTAARGFPLLSLGDGAVLRAFAGSVLYLGLIGLLSVGLSVLIRDPGAAIGTVLGLLYLAPIVAAVLGASPVWQHRVERYAPAMAGLVIQDTTGLHGLPVGPWGGLGVLAAWAGAALLAGGLALRWRDA